MSDPQDIQPGITLLSPRQARPVFLISGALFLAWIGVLGYLAATTAHPIVLSRPQFLVSTLDVIARVAADDSGKPMTTVQVQGGKLADQWLVIVNLREAEGWRTPGDYILPLVARDLELPLGARLQAYQVAPLPRSPGFAGTAGVHHRPRIYPSTRDTRGQLESIKPGL